MTHRSFVRPALMLGIVLATAGCAAVPPDDARAGVESRVASLGRDASAPADPDRLVAELLSQPLTPENAVRVALVASPRLEAEYARLGIAAADVYDAARLGNPVLSAEVLDSNAPGAARQKTFGIAQSFTSLLMLPARKRLAAGELERAQASVAAAVLELAADVERAYYTFVGAQQQLRLRESIARAAQLSAVLAQRLFDAGNVARRDLALELAAATQARLDVSAARAEAMRARTELNRLMGLGAGAPEWSAPARLGAPLPREDELDELLALADRARPDLAAARRQVALLADGAGVARRFRMLGEVSFGYAQERESDHERLTGPTLSLELPVFDRNEGSVMRAESQLRIADSELAALEVDIVNAVQLAHASVQEARARVREYEESLIPRREEVLELTQQQVNYMLMGQFELLLAKQQEYAAYEGYLEAVRDYWLARTELARAVGATLPSSAQPVDDTLDVEVFTQPRDTPHRLNREERFGPDSGGGHSHDDAHHHDHSAGQSDKQSHDHSHDHGTGDRP